MLGATELKRLRLPPGALPADVARQRRGALDHVRYYYLDRPFECRSCGKSEVWAAEQQKFWYEDCQGDLSAVAIHCRACRKKKSKTSVPVVKGKV
jgi:hypothetical protein